MVFRLFFPHVIDNSALVSSASIVVLAMVAGNAALAELATLAVLASLLSRAIRVAMDAVVASASCASLSARAARVDIFPGTWSEVRSSSGYGLLFSFLA